VTLLVKTIALLKEKGATIVEVELLKPIYAIGEAEGTILHYEFKDGLNKYLATANAKVKSLKDVIEYNNQNKALTMPYFKQETLVISEKKGGLDSKAYKDALAKSVTSRRLIDNILQQNRLDAICGTTNGPACCIDLINGDYDTGFSLSSPAAMAGHPHITVPMGFIHGLPIGFSFFGSAYSEQKLINLAYAFEQATKIRKAPEFLQQL